MHRTLIVLSQSKFTAGFKHLSLKLSIIRSSYVQLRLIEPTISIKDTTGAVPRLRPVLARCGSQFQVPEGDLEGSCLVCANPMCKYRLMWVKTEESPIDNDAAVWLCCSRQRHG